MSRDDEMITDIISKVSVDGCSTICLHLMRNSLLGGKQPSVRGHLEPTLQEHHDLGAKDFHSWLARIRLLSSASSALKASFCGLRKALAKKHAIPCAIQDGEAVNQESSGAIESWI